MAQKSWWIWLITGTLLGILLMVLLGKGCIEPKTVEHRIYKSDTVYKTITEFVIDSVPVPYEVVLPEKVIIYQDTGKHDTTYMQPGPDIWRYTPCYGYNQRFLNQYPHHSKLLQGDFTLDSISLTLLDTSGTIIKRTWPISYNIYDYRYRNNQLLANNREVTGTFKLPPSIKTSANIYGFYSLIHGGFTVASDFWVTRNRWSVGAIGELRTYQSYGDIRLGAKYRIK